MQCSWPVPLLDGGVALQTKCGAVVQSSWLPPEVGNTLISLMQPDNVAGMIDANGVCLLLLVALEEGFSDEAQFAGGKDHLGRGVGLGRLIEEEQRDSSLFFILDDSHDGTGHGSRVCANAENDEATAVVLLRFHLGDEDGIELFDGLDTWWIGRRGGMKLLLGINAAGSGGEPGNKVGNNLVSGRVYDGHGGYTAVEQQGCVACTE